MIYRDFALSACAFFAQGPRYDSIAFEFELPARVEERSRETCDLAKGVVFDTRSVSELFVEFKYLGGWCKRGTTEVKVVRRSIEN